MKLKALLAGCALMLSGAALISQLAQAPDTVSVKQVLSDEVVKKHQPELSSIKTEKTESIVLPGNSENAPALERLDYYSQALALLTHADEGDAEAQFQLAKILAHCDTINAWKPDFERDFSHFKAMTVSDADLRYMDDLIQEMRNCEQFIGQKLDMFSGQPLSGMQPLQVASVRYLNAALLGHNAAVMPALGSVLHTIKVDFDTKQLLAERLTAVLPSEPTETYIDLAAYQENELDQLAMVKLGCVGNVKCDSIDSVPLAHINFYGCMKSAVDDQIAGISTQPTDCAAQGLNHFIAEQSSKYSSDEISARMQQIRQAAQRGDLQAMGLSGLAKWLKTDDGKK